MYVNSSEELFPIQLEGSKTLAHIKGIFGKFALFTVSSAVETTEEFVDELTTEMQQSNPKLRKGSNYSIVHAAVRQPFM